MARPDRIFEWAIQDMDNDGNPLKAFPPLEVIQTGLLKDEPWARLWHNMLGNNFSLWIQHLSGEASDGGAEPVGTIRLLESGSTADPNTVWSGTWTQRGTDTLGTATVKVYEKTAL